MIIYEEKLQNNNLLHNAGNAMIFVEYKLKSVKPRKAKFFEDKTQF